MNEIKHVVIRLADWISSCVNRSVHGPELARMFGLAVVIYFFTVGFLCGYLAIRLLLARLLRKADKSLEEIAKNIGMTEGMELGKAEGLKIGKTEGLNVATSEINTQKLISQAANLAPVGDANAKARLAVAEQWDSSITASVPDDPQKGRFGGQAEMGGRRLSAVVTPLKDEKGELFNVNLKVETVDAAKPITDPVKFFLHDTFDPDTFVIPPKNGVAGLEELISWGAFTVGVMTDGGKTMLELDLAQLPDAPMKFRSR